MRAVAVLLFFAVAFGFAALWQSHRAAQADEARALAARAQAGEVGLTDLGPLEPGWAAVVIGRPAGVEPAGEANDEAAPAPPQEPVPPQPQPPDDFEVLIEAGQSLSEVARAHYGTAPVALVRALALYNGLADENSIRAGQKLRLPPIERLRD